MQPPLKGPYGKPIARASRALSSSISCAALLAGLLLTVPATDGVRAQIVGPLNTWSTAPDIDPIAACDEMLAVTDQLAATKEDGTDNSNNITACDTASKSRWWFRDFLPYRWQKVIRIR